MTGPVGLRAADLCLLLPFRPATCQVLGPLEAFRDGLREAGLVTSGDAPDVVVAPVGLADAAVALRPRALLLLGRAPARPLRAAGYRVRRLLATPDPERPRLLVPLEPGPVRVALRHVSPRRPRRLAARDTLVLGALSAGRAPARMTVTVASRDEPRPWLVDAAVASGGDPSGPWFLQTGTGDDLQRVVLHLPSPGRGRVVKTSRTPGGTAAFDRDERAAALVRDLPPQVLARVPRLLRRDRDGVLPVAVEERAPGRQLLDLVGSRWPADRRLAEVEPVAAWLLDLAEATRTPAGGAAGELARLRDEVLPAWRELEPGLALPPGLLDAVADVPGVLAHNDLGCWNIVADGEGRFGVVDWESARRPGLPLWDLVYFLSDALATLEHPEGGDGPRRAGHVLSVLRGEDRHSPVLFDHVSRYAARLGLPPAAVGPLVTLSWLHHGLSPAARAAALGDDGAPPGAQALLAGPWLADPALGPTWRAWRRFAGEPA